MKRPIYTIAAEIKKVWGAKVYFGAKPYLDAMTTLSEPTDMYIHDSAKTLGQRKAV